MSAKKARGLETLHDNDQPQQYRQGGEIKFAQ
ncbi:MAG: hypothetical protein ACI9BH_000878, partial [Paracoccaceae bacterium]